MYKPLIHARLGQAESLLADLIGMETLSGREEPAIRRMEAAFRELGDSPELRDVSDSIKADPDYAGLELGLEYVGRHNLHLRRGAGEGRSVILQTHLDVVPAGDWEDAFRPRREGDLIYGRGACDCKGQTVTIWLALAALADAGVRLRGELQVQLVIEEEIGGNGALAAILGGDRADAAVILEPTSLQVHPACRGAIWFRITVPGRAVHMGRKQEGINAIERAMPIIAALQEYERDLIAASRNVPLFERYEHPVQVNVGTIRAGDWPSMVPEECVIEGGVGFLPNTPMLHVKVQLCAIVAAVCGDCEPAMRPQIEFPKLRNDAYASDPNHPAVQSLASACRAAGLPTEVFGWNVSCDSRLYALRGGMPAIVFGPGDVKDAHSNHERISLAEIAQAAEALAGFVVDWCGVVSYP